MIQIQVQTADFDHTKLYHQLSQNHEYGAIVTFTGLVRQTPQGNLVAMTLEHYPGMTEKALHAIAEQAMARWPIGQVVIVHRVGELSVNEQIVFVGVASGHRVEAFAAAEFMMDYLKNRAPFWKKEITTQGSHWVEAKQSDQEAMERWSSK